MEAADADFANNDDERFLDITTPDDDDEVREADEGDLDEDVDVDDFVVRIDDVGEEEELETDDVEDIFVHVTV